MHKRQRGHSFWRSRIARLVTGAALLFLAMGAGASLIGDTADCAATGAGPGFDCFPTSAVVVSPGAEFNLRQLGIGNELQLDIDSDTITISLGSSISGIVFGFAGLGFSLSSLDDSNGPLVGFSLALFGNVQGFNPSAITLSAHSLDVLFDGISFDYPHDPDITDSPRAVITFVAGRVPEPSTIALFALAALAMVWSRRHQVWARR